MVCGAVTEKIKVLSAVFMKSSCPLIWGLWPAFVAPVLCETLPLARTLSVSDPEECSPLRTALCWSGQLATPQDFKAVGRACWIPWIRGIFTKVPLATSRQESLTSVNHHVNPCGPLPARNMNEMLTRLYSSQPEKAQLFI